MFDKNLIRTIININYFIIELSILLLLTYLLVRTIVE